MAKPPGRPSKLKADAPRAAVADRALVAKPADPRQAGLFDEPLPKWVRPCLPTLVDRPPVGSQWVHEVKWDGYRVSVYLADGTVTIRTRGGHAGQRASRRSPAPLLKPWRSATSSPSP